VLAPRELPPDYASWNERHRAPYGRVLRGERVLGRISPATLRWRGPFGWQANSRTRTFEFPWAYEQVSREGPGRTVLEIGGGMSGLQFVLGSEGHHVTNLDPGVTPAEALRSGLEFTVSTEYHRRLSKAFRAPVRLLPTTIGRADLPDHSFDVVLSVSAIEHFTDESLDELAEHLGRVLKPDGLVVLTVDLFFDIRPFTTAEANYLGRNVDVRDLLDRCGLRLDEGRREELFGFPEFDTDRVQRQLAGYLTDTDYPVLSQCFTARPADGSART
jgi:SAM-dependent methyltransferase